MRAGIVGRAVEVAGGKGQVRRRPRSAGAVAPAPVTTGAGAAAAARAGAQAGISCAPLLAKGGQLPAYRVHRGIDFLKVSFWLDWQSTAFLDLLKQKKEALQATETEECVSVSYAGRDWNLFRTGARMFAYRLKCGDVTVLLSSRGSNSNVPSARLEIGSLTAQTDLQATFRGIKAYLPRVGGKIVKEQVSEVHLAVDFIGLAIGDLDLDNRHRWISRAIDWTPYYSHWQLTGVSVGKGDIMLRCYDKVRELREATHKQTVFASLWSVEHFDDFPVTRVEYQLRRPVLKDFKGLDCANGLTLPEELLCALASLWRYCTEDWTRFMATMVDRANRHQDRGCLAAFWEAVKGVVWSNIFSVLRERPEMHKDLVKLRKQVLGGMMSVIAFFQHDIYDFHEIIALGKQLIEEDLRAFQRDEGEFIKRMMRKRNEAILSDMVPF